MATWYIKLVDDELVGLVGDVLQNDWNMTNWSEKNGMQEVKTTLKKALIMPIQWNYRKEKKWN